MYPHLGRAPEMHLTAPQSRAHSIFARITSWGTIWLSGFLSSLLLILPITLHSADFDEVARGKAILEAKCGRCHAVGAIGESPLKMAPPMRDIYARFAPRELQEELLEGMVSRHKEMPQIQFSHEDVHAILSYLYELARRK